MAKHWFEPDRLVFKAIIQSRFSPPGVLFLLPGCTSISALLLFCLGDVRRVLVGTLRCVIVVASPQVEMLPLFLFALLSLNLACFVFVVAEVGAVSGIVVVRSRLRATAAQPIFVKVVFLTQIHCT
ncbi:hypothetical protein [Vreelandella massiliensis]|uniref:hypothetical protein n=1 Tax=Vreelandella massiliensis TaxID=1816686 RepID=UPI001181BAC4|nr:hypothetical protein [Halomonas massiliensis]MYL24874.1 hypothetical protein [Halomonas alkaliantarctica]